MIQIVIMNVKEWPIGGVSPVSFLCLCGEWGVSPVLSELRRIRESKFLSQVELSKLSGISRVTIARIETGENARGSTVRKLAEALGVEPSQLVTA